MILNAIRGFCMALADSVPGVSGGTIAFLMGFYDEFINSINDIVSGSKEKKISGIKFLIKLGIGWIIGMGLAVSILANVFESGIYKVSSLFLGFIILAIPVMIAEEKECLKGKYQNIIFAIIGIAVVAGITYFNSNGVVEHDVANLNIGLILYLIVAGMVAISAMVLPGISGSTLLLIFGLYMPVISTVKELMHFNFSNILLIVFLGIGVILGVIVVIRLIKKSLEKFRSQTIYMVLGMMIGSLYAIVMGPTTLKVPKEAMSFSTFSIVFFIIGGVIVFGMQFLKKIFEGKEKADEKA